MNIEGQQLAQQISAKALQLVQKYYECLDNVDRRQEWTNFFLPIATRHPLMQWNGHVLANVDDVIGYAKMLPKTKHHTTSIDAQPLMGTNDFVVTIQGTVIYGDDHKRRFFHRIIATRQQQQGGDRTYISSDYYRWTGQA